mmetsp:Transcript_33798/g.88787  ORF Transcript_33798/g.88787 Transcript_33798/m.88787 type:complete len:223 (-) Transcript_33798:56-724(-)
MVDDDCHVGDGAVDLGKFGILVRIQLAVEGQAPCRKGLKTFDPICVQHRIAKRFAVPRPIWVLVDNLANPTEPIDLCVLVEDFANRWGLERACRHKHIRFLGRCQLGRGPCCLGLAVRHKRRIRPLHVDVAYADGLEENPPRMVNPIGQPLELRFIAIQCVHRVVPGREQDLGIVTRRCAVRNVPHVEVRVEKVHRCPGCPSPASYPRRPLIPAASVACCPP